MLCIQMLRVLFTCSVVTGDDAVLYADAVCIVDVC